MHSKLPDKVSVDASATQRFCGLDVAMPSRYAICIH